MSMEWGSHSMAVEADDAPSRRSSGWSEHMDVACCEMQAGCGMFHQQPAKLRSMPGVACDRLFSNERHLQQCALLTSCRRCFATQVPAH